MWSDNCRASSSAYAHFVDFSASQLSAWVCRAALSLLCHNVLWANSASRSSTCHAANIHIFLNIETKFKKIIFLFSHVFFCLFSSILFCGFGISRIYLVFASYLPRICLVFEYETNTRYIRGIYEMNTRRSERRAKEGGRRRAIGGSGFCGNGCVGAVGRGVGCVGNRLLRQ